MKSFRGLVSQKAWGKWAGFQLSPLCGRVEGNNVAGRHKSGSEGLVDFPIMQDVKCARVCGLHTTFQNPPFSLGYSLVDFRVIFSRTKDPPPPSSFSIHFSPLNSLISIFNSLFKKWVFDFAVYLILYTPKIADFWELFHSLFSFCRGIMLTMIFSCEFSKMLDFCLNLYELVYYVSA
jgi:hypothetical protein